jgi:hypothetical protein
MAIVEGDFSGRGWRGLFGFRRLCGAAVVILALSATGAGAVPLCSDLAARLPRLGAQGSVELAAAGGRTFKRLYDECDRHDRFAGARLPNGRRCSTDPNKVDFVRRYQDGTVVFRSKMGVDSDGSPASMGPGHSGTDQPETWLTFDPGSDRRFVNAEEVSFVVVPLSAPAGDISFLGATGIRKGDLVAVFANGRCSFGVVGDAGPYFRLGEASLKAHQDLGNPQCAVAGQHPCRRLRAHGSGVGIESGVTFVIFPGTRPAPLLSQTVSGVADDAARARVAQFFDRFAP